MKKKQLLAGALTACMAMSLPLTANAAEIAASKYDGKVYAEGQMVGCLNEQKQIVPVLKYQGTTYIPIRTAGEWMGKNVAWNSETKTVTLSEQTTPVYYNSMDLTAADTPYAASFTGTSIQMTQRQDIQVILDGKTQSFKNVNGEAVYPMAFGGTTYLPLRSIGELANMEVSWVADAQASSDGTIFMQTAMSQTEKDEVRAYIVKQADFMKKIVSVSHDLNTAKTMDAQTKANLTSLKELLQESLAVQTPGAKLAAAPDSRYKNYLNQAQTEIGKLTENATVLQVCEATNAVEDDCYMAALNELIELARVYTKNPVQDASLVDAQLNWY